MLPATAGTWLNYSTTFFFQILFARAYGATSEASAFIVVFGMVLALAGLFVSTSTTLVVPRLLTPEGSVRTGALRFLAVVGMVGATFLGAATALAGPIASSLDPLLDGDHVLVRDLIRLGALFALLQLAAGQVASVCLVRGARFAPAVAPGFPTLLGAVWLVAQPDADPRSTLGVLAAGSFVQLAFLAACLPRPLRLESARLPGIGALAVVTAGQLVLLSLLPSVERLLAATADPYGAGRYNYAMSSLVAAQQLLIGGLVVSSLADWSVVGPAGTATRQRLVRRLALAGGALLTAGAFAAVAAPGLVRLVYEHGDFTPGDTEVVARLLRLALPGFVAGGLGMVLSQAFLSARRNAEAIAVGVTRFILRGSFASFGVAFGGLSGLVIGVSVAECVMLVVQASLWWRRPANSLGFT